MHSIPQQQQHGPQRRKRAAYSSNRIIPSLRRHETMLFGDPLKPVACQSQDNYAAFAGMVDESSDEERRRGSQSSCSSVGTSQESVSLSEG